MIKETLPIRAYDIDAMGYVSNIVYIRWFEDLRHHFLDKYYPFERMMEDRISPVITHCEADYKHHLDIYDKPEGICRLEKWSLTKWVMKLEVFQGKKVHCSGIQKGYFIDLQTYRPAPIPKDMISIIEEEASLQGC